MESQRSAHWRRRTSLGGLTLLIFTLALGILAAPPGTGAQQAGKVYRIGWLSLAFPTDAGAARAREAVAQGLRELGWVEGKNLVMERRFAEGRAERLPGLAADLVRLKVDVIVAMTTPAALAAKDATAAIPIVMVAVGDPVETGLVTSLARPGGNLTGVSLLAGLEIIGKQMELLKEAVPKVSRVALLWNPANPAHPLILKEAEGAARQLGVQLQRLEARGSEAFDAAFSAMIRGRTGALLVVADAMFVSHRRRLADLAAKNRLPAMYGFREFVEAGGLMSYGPSISDLLGRVPTYVDKILRGAKPGDLPVEQPTKFELIINLKAAKALGLSIPRSILLRAEEVIQ